MSTEIKCGECNKHYRCTTCDSPCGADGHFIEVEESRKSKIVSILTNNADASPIINSSSDMSYTNAVHRSIPESKFGDVADKILSMLVS